MMSAAACRAFAQRLAGAFPPLADPLLFARELFNEPAAVGALWPSSKRLARRMAARVPVHRDGLVIELGGGTGAVTEALLARGISPERLLVIERSPLFVRHLRARFPGVTVLQGDAIRLAHLVPRDRAVDAIVSSLPLRSLPPRDVATIVAQWWALLATGGTVVQFTYALSRRRRLSLPGFSERASEIVWGNLPPARVLALECHRPHASHLQRGSARHAGEHITTASLP